MKKTGKAVGGDEARMVFNLTVDMPDGDTGVVCCTVNAAHREIRMSEEKRVTLPIPTGESVHRSANLPEGHEPVIDTRFLAIRHTPGRYDDTARTT